MSGVFLELYKSPGVKRYTTNEIFKMEKLLSFYDKTLQSPRLIAMAPWRVYSAIMCDPHANAAKCGSSEDSDTMFLIPT